MNRTSFSEPSTETPKTYPSKTQTELFEAILKLKTTQECAKFFRDLLTLAEISEFANRWQTVKLLLKGKSYTTIAQELKVSSSTVTRVAHWLKNGLGGYRLVADRSFEKKITSSAKHHPRLHGKRWLA